MNNRWKTLKTVGKYTGLIQILVAGLILSVLPISLIYREWYQALWFVCSSVLVAMVGCLLYLLFRSASPPDKLDSVLTAAFAWLVTACLGTLPFLFSAHFTPPALIESFVPAGAEYTSSLLNFTHPLHAFFESMSGWTTTGLTMAVHEPSLPRSLLWYRSFMQWVGGIGVIVLALSVFPQPGTSSPDFLYRAEAREKKVRPSVISTVQAIFSVYLINTIVASLWLTIGAIYLMPDYPWSEALWDGVNHGMTVISTGGFSVLDNSLAEYGSNAMEMWTLPVMIMGGISLPFYYLIYFSRSVREAFKDVQLKVYFSLLALGTPLLIVFLMQTFSEQTALYHGLFQYVSALSTTGFQTSPIGEWNFSGMLFLIGGSMFIGGTAGATVGGVKIIRIYLVVRGIGWKIKQAFFPENAVTTFDISDETYSLEEARSMFYDAAILCMAYGLIVVSAIVFLAYFSPAETPAGHVIFDAVSAQSTVGLSSGFTGPDMTIQSELILILLMWIGRLEIIPILLFAYVIFGGSFRYIEP